MLPVKEACQVFHGCKRWVFSCRGGIDTWTGKLQGNKWLREGDRHSEEFGGVRVVFCRKWYQSQMLRWPCYIPLHLISCFIRSLLSIFFFVLTARLWIQVFIFSVVAEDALFLISARCPFHYTHWSQRRLSRTLFSCLCPAQVLFTTFITVWIKCCTDACT